MLEVELPLVDVELVLLDEVLVNEVVLEDVDVGEVGEPVDDVLLAVLEVELALDVGLTLVDFELALLDEVLVNEVLLEDVDADKLLVLDVLVLPRSNQSRRACQSRARAERKGSTCLTCRFAFGMIGTKVCGP